jgi:hypothetical protein
VSSGNGSWIARQWADTTKLWRASYLSFDRRTLGLTRLLLGFYLICDLFRRTGDWVDMFSDHGVQPTYVILNRPAAGGYSLLHAFTTAPELWALWLVVLATFVSLFVGYRTKLMQVLSLVFVTSMNGRVLLIENGGYVVQNLLLLWTMFLPLGDRFSVDALFESMRRRRERTAAELNDRSELVEPFRLEQHVSIVGLAICLQIAAIYYFNVIHKTGPAWKRDFTAVHYVMYVDRMVSPLPALVREYVPFWVYKPMTMSVIASEAGLPFCMLLPRIVVRGVDFKVWMRRFALGFVNFLHIGFGSTFVLGPFAWALCTFSSLFVSYDDWQLAIRAMRRSHRERTVLFDPSSGAALFAARVIARLDRFELLGFDEAKGDEARHGLAILRPSGELVTGHRAAFELVSALPGGPIVAWLALVPGLRSLVDALLARGWSRRLGLSPELGPTQALVPARYRAMRVRRWVGEAICVAFMLSALNQALVELWSTKKRWADAIAKVNEKTGWKLQTHPESMRLLAHKLRFLQGWFMFSPNPVMDDGTIIVDAITVDGRHVDPFWAKAPNFDLLNAKSFGYNQIWSDYFNRMHLPGNKQYRDSMVDYMRRLPERTGNPNDALASGEVYWVKDMNPKWRSTKSYNEQRELLFSFGKDGGAKDPPREAAKPGT